MNSTVSVPTLHAGVASVDVLKVRGVDSVGAEKWRSVTDSSIAISQADFNGGVLSMDALNGAVSVAVDVDSIVPGTAFTFDVYRLNGIDPLTLTLSSARAISGIIAYTDGTDVETTASSTGIVLDATLMTSGRLTVCVLGSYVRISGSSGTGKATPFVTFT